MRKQHPTVQVWSVLRAGHSIRVGVVPGASAGIDTPEDDGDVAKRYRAVV